jgi:hypothetical protein
MLEGGRNWRDGIVAAAAMRVKGFFENVEFLFHAQYTKLVDVEYRSHFQ